MATLGSKIGISRQAVAKIESGDSKHFAVLNALAAAKEFSMSVEELVTGKRSGALQVQEEAAVYDVRTSEDDDLGTMNQLLDDWKALPEGWRYHICRKVRRLREETAGMALYVRDSIKPITDDAAYRAWERRLEESLAAKDREDQEERERVMRRDARQKKDGHR